MFRFRPSAAHCWVNCAGYINMAAQYPQLPEDTDYIREEGIAAHWAASKLLRDDWVPVGEIAPNGIELTEELLDGAQMFVDVVRGWSDQFWSEHALHAPLIHEQCGGTPDAFGISKNYRFLRIADLKMGYRPHDPFEHWQLLCYYAACFTFFGFNGATDQELIVEFTIVQPRWFGREGPVKKWTVRGSDLRGLVNRLHMAAAAAALPEPLLTAGSHCEHCSARHACPAAQNAALQLLDLSARSIPNDLDPASTAALLYRITKAAELLDAMKTGLEARAQHMISNGVVVPGYILERGKGRRRYTSYEAEQDVMTLGDMLGKNLRKPQRAVTPTEALKMVDPAMLAPYIDRPETGIKLRRVDDNAARKIFQSNGVSQE